MMKGGLMGNPPQPKITCWAWNLVYPSTLSRRFSYANTLTPPLLLEAAKLLHRKGVNEQLQNQRKGAFTHFLNSLVKNKTTFLDTQFRRMWVSVAIQLVSLGLFTAFELLFSVRKPNTVGMWLPSFLENRRMNDEYDKNQEKRIKVMQIYMEYAKYQHSISEEMLLKLLLHSTKNFKEKVVFLADINKTCQINFSPNSEQKGLVFNHFWNCKYRYELFEQQLLLDIPKAERDQKLQLFAQLIELGHFPPNSDNHLDFKYCPHVLEVCLHGDKPEACALLIRKMWEHPSKPQCPPIRVLNRMVTYDFGYEILIDTAIEINEHLLSTDKLPPTVYDGERTKVLTSILSSIFCVVANLRPVEKAIAEMKSFVSRLPKFDVHAPIFTSQQRGEVSILSECSMLCEIGYLYIPFSVIKKMVDDHGVRDANLLQKIVSETSLQHTERGYPLIHHLAQQPWTILTKSNRILTNTRDVPIGGGPFTLPTFKEEAATSPPIDDGLRIDPEIHQQIRSGFSKSPLLVQFLTQRLKLRNVNKDVASVIGEFLNMDEICAISKMMHPPKPPPPTKIAHNVVLFKDL